MAIRPEKLAELVSIPLEAAQLILGPDMSEQEFLSRWQELVPLSKDQLSKDERTWIWEIHKNCDQLLHQRLASFTAAQAMTLASFSVLTVARFNASACHTQAQLASVVQAQSACIPLVRLGLLDAARVWVVVFGIFLAGVGWLVTYPMFQRLKYLNTVLLFRDSTYHNYFHCITWKEKTWGFEKKEDTKVLYRFYSRFIPLWLPIAEGVFWLVLLGLLVVALVAQKS